MQRGMPGLGSVKFGDWKGGGAYEVGYALFTEYLLPFEVTSVLILIAIVGAVVLATLVVLVSFGIYGPTSQALR